MKNSRKKVVFLLLALTLLLSACGQEKVAEPIPTPPQPTEKMEDAIVPTEPPTTETKEATEDYSTVNENDVIHAEIESAAIDNNMIKAMLAEMKMSGDMLSAFWIMMVHL